MRERSNEKIKSTDIFLGAYLITEGYYLEAMHQGDSKSKYTISFEYSGDGIKNAAQEFLMGRATTNVRLYRVSLNFLKDQIHDKMRERDLEIERKWKNERKASSEHQRH